MGFVYDDQITVVNNPEVQSAQNILALFGAGVRHSAWQGWRNYYRPIFFLWLLGNYSAFGLRPAGWHLAGLALHAANCLLVYFLALRLVRRRLPALFSGLLFGLHPVQVEVVSWISASTELLATFFALASFLSYLRAAESGLRWTVWHLAAPVLYAAAALSKETAVLLPGLVLLHEWLGRPACATPSPPPARNLALRRALAACAPFFIVGTVWLCARIAVLGSLTQTATPLTLQTRLETLPGILGNYLLHLLWPAGLSPLYDYRYVSQYSASAVLVPLVLVAIAGLAVFLSVRNSPSGKLAGVWILLALLPALHISIFPPNDFQHDRYLYHPMVGVALLAGLGLAWLEEHSAPARPLLWPGAAVVIAAAGLVTFRQTAYWTDNLALYSRGYEVAPHNSTAINNLGVELMDRGQVDQAQALFEAGYRENPNLWLAQYNLGRIYYDKGLYPEAVTAFQKSISAEPNYPASYMHLGMTYFRLGQLNLAIDSVKKAITLEPNAVGYHFALGIMLKQSGDLAGARAEFAAELKRDPNHRPALVQLRLLDQAGTAALSPGTKQ
jgi:Flp pilus assembly protein TadD